MTRSIRNTCKNGRVVAKGRRRHTTRWTWGEDGGGLLRTRRRGRGLRMVKDTNAQNKMAARKATLVDSVLIV
jgi:hypothetical protein